MDFGGLRCGSFGSLGLRPVASQEVSGVRAVHTARAFKFCQCVLFSIVTNDFEFDLVRASSLFGRSESRRSTNKFFHCLESQLSSIDLLSIV